jgi:hypothetical protein
MGESIFPAGSLLSIFDVKKALVIFLLISALGFSDLLATLSGKTICEVNSGVSVFLFLIENIITIRNKNPPSAKAMRLTFHSVISFGAEILSFTFLSSAEYLTLITIFFLSLIKLPIKCY